MTKEQLEKTVIALSEENQMLRDTVTVLSGRLMQANLKIEKLEEMIEAAIDDNT